MYLEHKGHLYSVRVVQYNQHLPEAIGWQQAAQAVSTVTAKAFSKLKAITYSTNMAVRAV